MDPNIANQTPPPVSPQVEPNPSISTIPSTPESVPMINENPIKPNNKKRNSILIFLIIFTLVSSGLVFAYMQSLKSPTKNSGEIVKNNTDTNTLLSVSQFIDCSNIRTSIEVDGTLYLACRGGVEVLDSTTLKLIDKFTQKDGLTDYITTSLAKKGDKLYVGTQNGVSIINLKSREIVPLTTKEGLVNGANILATLDGDWLWISTFKGIARYNTTASKLENINEFSSYNGLSISSSSKAVYFTGYFSVNGAVGGSAVLRFDKATNSWKTIQASSFENPVNSAQLNQIKVFGDKVIVSDGYYFWIADDNFDSNFKQLDIQTIIRKATLADKDHNYLLLGENSNSFLLFDRGDRIVVSVDKNLAIANVLYPLRWQGESTNVFTDSQNIQLDNDKLVGYPKLASFDLSSKKEKVFDNFENSNQITKLYGAINSKAVMADSQNNINLLDPTTGEKEKLANFDKLQLNWSSQLSKFIPIVGTSKVLIYGQACGQGCQNPYVYILDMQNKFTKEIEIPSNIIKNPALPLVLLGNLDETKTFVFLEEEPEGQKNFITLNTDSLAWNKTTEKPSTVNTDVINPKSQCNPNFKFENNIFTDSQNCKIIDIKSVTNQNFKWSVDEKEKLLKTNLSDNLQKPIELLKTEPRYSPFDYSIEGEQSVNLITLFNNYLYVNTNLGLIKINTQNDEQELISTKDGLVSNTSSAFVATEKGIWVNAGVLGVETFGLSFIPKK